MGRRLTAPSRRRLDGCPPRDASGRRVRAEHQGSRRAGKVQPVTEWHIGALAGWAFVMLRHGASTPHPCATGQNSDKRQYESVILFPKWRAAGC